LKFTVIDNATVPLTASITHRTSRAETIVVTQIKKDTSPYVPFKTGNLDQRTRVVDNTVIYPGPDARYLYYGHKMVDMATGKGPMHYVDRFGNEVFRYRKGAVLVPTEEPLTYNKDFHPLAGPHWFERSKAENLPKWLRVAEKAVNNA